MYGAVVTSAAALGLLQLQQKTKDIVCFAQNKIANDAETLKTDFIVKTPPQICFRNSMSKKAVFEIQ